MIIIKSHFIQFISPSKNGLQKASDSVIVTFKTNHQLNFGVPVTMTILISSTFYLQETCMNELFIGIIKTELHLMLVSFV